MPKINVRGLDLYYEISGTGPKLLYINGTGGDLRKRPSVFDGPLSKSFEVLSYDQRGMGRTSKPDAEYTMTDYAEDAAALLDALGWGPVPVIGYSFGGTVAQELCLTHSEKVTQLGLICTSSGGEGGAAYPLHELQDLEPKEKASVMLELSDSRQNSEWRAREPEYFQMLQDFVIANNEVGDDDPSFRIGEARQLAARLGHDTWDRLPGVKQPVYLIAGKYDQLCPLSNLENIRKQIPGSKLKILEGGHQCMLYDKSGYPWLIQNINS